MSRTLVTPTLSTGAYPAAGNTLAKTAGDTVNHLFFPASGRDLVIVENTDSAPHTATINSTADDKGRLGDITAETIAAGATHIFGPLAKAYWAQPDGTIHLDVSDATVKVSVVQLP
jgi:hypothetical protein